jgi:hypothetical protein
VPTGEQGQAQSRTVINAVQNFVVIFSRLTKIKRFFLKSKFWVLNLSNRWTISVLYVVSQRWALASNYPEYTTIANPKMFTSTRSANCHSANFIAKKLPFR